MTIVVTDKRVLLMERRFHWGAPTYGCEEAFPIDTLKVSFADTLVSSWLNT